jgi:hypothetical protein
MKAMPARNTQSWGSGFAPRILAITVTSLVASCSSDGTRTAPVPVRPPIRPPATTSVSPTAAAPSHVRPMLRRLGAREYVASVRALTGIEVDRKKLAPLDLARRFDNGDPDTWVTSDVLAATETVAWELATQVTAELQTERPTLVFGLCSKPAACTGLGSAESTLLAHLLDTFLPKLFRRPLSVEERASYTKFANETAAEEGAEEALRMLFARALQSPAFLYREEVGTLAPNATGPNEGLVRTLSMEETAASIAFLVTGETPDTELLSAAAIRALAQPEVRASQVERLWDTEAGRAQRRRFFQEYLAVKELRLLRKDKVTVPDWSSGTPTPGQLLSADLDRFLADVVQEGGSVQTLLTKPGTLSPMLPEGYRAQPVRGVLTHPGFLATHGGYEDSGPIGRGVFVLSRLLCNAPPAPPPGIPRAPSEGPEDNTTRARFTAHSQDATCQGCHQSIDGAGFGFEHYDGAGRYRSQENGLPIDATGKVTLAKVEQPYVGVVQLSQLLAGSNEVSSCLGRYYLRFAFGGERATYAPLFDRLAVSTDANETLKARTLKLVQDAAFVTREAKETP